MGKKLNLGASKDIRSHADQWVNADINRSPGIDLCFDAGKHWPFPSSYFELIHASHVLEHIEIKNLDTCMKEANRTLEPNGTFDIRVPFGPKGTQANDELHHLNEFYVTSLQPYCQGNGQNTSLDYDWEQPLFKLESREVIRIFWQRERLGKLLGKWVEKSYTWPKVGIPVEIHWILRRT
jgi:ubiquinone/menaquinone biosynthesis C-methylase UbiE